MKGKRSHLGFVGIRRTLKHTFLVRLNVSCDTSSTQRPSQSISRHLYTERVNTAMIVKRDVRMRTHSKQSRTFDFLVSQKLILSLSVFKNSSQ